MPAVEIPAAGDEYLRGYLYKYKPLPELQPDQFWEDDFLICPHAEDDKDNPEDRWAIGAELDNRSLCGSCGGGGLIQEYGELYCCPKCGGWGSI
ncbi:hypothetical protein [Nostoc sp.]|uniref:hypothetical protein n=1 Tax=Nostoc sp. TaxID=1180 RepID=UPI002FFBC11F